MLICINLYIYSLKIHFIHAKPTNAKGKKVVPLLLMHGWPGTVREFYDFIPLLTKGSDKSDYVFEVIAPSLPGYGWSQVSSRINSILNLSLTEFAFIYNCRALLDLAWASPRWP